MALLDGNGAMCAFGDVGPEYNCLPLAVTNIAGTQDAASADQCVPPIINTAFGIKWYLCYRYGWILPFALSRNGEDSRATAVRALRECLHIAVDESQLQPHGSNMKCVVLGCACCL